MATAVKAASAGMTGAVRSLQWTIQDMNGSVEHLGQSHDHLRRAQNIMAWTTAIFGALLLSGLVWIANDIFHLKDQLMETDRHFDSMDAQMNALGTRMDDLAIAIEQIGAELRAARGVNAPVTGPDVSVLSTPNTPQQLQAAGAPPLETTTLDAAAQPQQQVPQPQAQQQAALAPAQPAPPDEVVDAATIAGVVAPAPPAPRDDLTPQELAAPAPVLAAVAPAAPAPAAPQAAAPAPAAQAQAAAAVPAAASAPAPAPAASGANLSDDQLLSFNDDQIDPADELLLLDENGNPQ